MNKAEKIELTEELKAAFNKSNGFFVTDYRGLTVEKVTKLRFNLHKAGAQLRVVKNRLALRAINDKEGWKSSHAHFDYMSAVAFSNGDISAAAKAIIEFAKDNEALKIKGGVVEGKVVSLAEIKALSKLPSRPELLAKLLGTLQSVPTSFVRVLNGVPSKWVYLLEAVKQKKGAA